MTFSFAPFVCQQTYRVGPLAAIHKTLVSLVCATKIPEDLQLLPCWLLKLANALSFYAFQSIHLTLQWDMGKSPSLARWKTGRTSLSINCMRQFKENSLQCPHSPPTRLARAKDSPIPLSRDSRGSIMGKCAPMSETTEENIEQLNRKTEFLPRPIPDVLPWAE